MAPNIKEEDWDWDKIMKESEDPDIEPEYDEIDWDEDPEDFDDFDEEYEEFSSDEDD